MATHERYFQFVFRVFYALNRIDVVMHSFIEICFPWVRTFCKSNECVFSSLIRTIAFICFCDTKSQNTGYLSGKRCQTFLRIFFNTLFRTCDWPLKLILELIYISYKIITKWIKKRDIKLYSIFMQHLTFKLYYNWSKLVISNFALKIVALVFKFSDKNKLRKILKHTENNEKVWKVYLQWAFISSRLIGNLNFGSPINSSFCIQTSALFTELHSFLLFFWP